MSPSPTDDLCSEPKDYGSAIRHPVATTAQQATRSTLSLCISLQIQQVTTGLSVNVAVQSEATPVASTAESSPVRCTWAELRPGRAVHAEGRTCERAGQREGNDLPQGSLRCPRGRQPRAASSLLPVASAHTAPARVYIPELTVTPHTPSHTAPPNRSTLPHGFPRRLVFHSPLLKVALEQGKRSCSNSLHF